MNESRAYKIPDYHELCIGFPFHGKQLPLWVVAVQWRRYRLLGLRLRGWRYPKDTQVKQRARIEMFLRTGTATYAARAILEMYGQRNEKSADGRTIISEGAAIRRAVAGMLETMREKDHGAEWI